jgi:hypothetical protein
LQQLDARPDARLAGRVAHADDAARGRQQLDLEPPRLPRHELEPLEAQGTEARRRARLDHEQPRPGTQARHGLDAAGVVPAAVPPAAAVLRSDAGRDHAQRVVLERRTRPPVAHAQLERDRHRHAAPDHEPDVGLTPAMHALGAQRPVLARVDLERERLVEHLRGRDGEREASRAVGRGLGPRVVEVLVTAHRDARDRAPELVDDGPREADHRRPRRQRPSDDVVARG